MLLLDKILLCFLKRDEWTERSNQLIQKKKNRKLMAVLCPFYNSNLSNGTFLISESFT